MLHRKYDRNLTRDSDTDIFHHLYEKQLRTERMLRPPQSRLNSRQVTPQKGRRYLPNSNHDAIGMPFVLLFHDAIVMLFVLLYYDAIGMLFVCYTMTVLAVFICHSFCYSLILLVSIVCYSFCYIMTRGRLAAKF